MRSGSSPRLPYESALRCLCSSNLQPSQQCAHFAELRLPPAAPGGAQLRCPVNRQSIRTGPGVPVYLFVDPVAHEWAVQSSVVLWATRQATGATPVLRHLVPAGFASSGRSASIALRRSSRGRPWWVGNGPAPGSDAGSARRRGSAGADSDKAESDAASPTSTELAADSGAAPPAAAGGGWQRRRSLGGERRRRPAGRAGIAAVKGVCCAGGNWRGERAACAPSLQVQMMFATRCINLCSACCLPPLSCHASLPLECRERLAKSTWRGTPPSQAASWH